MTSEKHRRLARLLARTELSPGVESYRLGVEGSSPFSWAPGQYVELFAPSAPDLPLPYSIASAPNALAPGEFELAIGAGSGKELLSSLPLGTELQMSGPFGRMIWPPSGSAALLVGTGTGVAPLRALLQETLPGADTHPVVLLAGFRSEVDVLWRAELERLQAERSRLRCLFTLTQPEPSWTGLCGRVQEHVVGLARGLTDPSVFLCGGKSMVDECERLLVTQAGVPPGRILAEGY